MATFELTAPDGNGIFHVEAPDEHAAVAALGQMLAPKAQAAAPAAEPQSALQRIREAIHAPTRALENGILFGLGDRARAGMGAIIGDGSYGTNLKTEQGETEQFAKDHPVAAPVLEGVGGAVAPIGALAAAAKGTGLGAKILYGGGAGGAIGGIQGAVGSKDYTDLPQVGKDAGIGAGVGLLVGGALPATGAAIGAGYNAVANFARGRVDGMSRAAGGHLVSAMEADGPAAVQARMRELGPEANLADAGPSFLGKAQGASLNSDEGRSVLQGALTTRNEGTNARISGDVERALGPAEDPQTVRNAIVAHRSDVDSRNYPAAFRNAPPVDTSNVLVELGPMIQGSPTGSMERRALENLRGMLMTERPVPRLDPNTGAHMSDAHGNRLYDMVPEPQSDPQLLHKIKGEIDNVVEYDAPGLGIPAAALSRQQGALKHVRGVLNETLEQQVPGYMSANRQSAGLANRGEAVELGTQYLGNGKTTASPDRFAAAFDPLSPGEKIAFAKGSRGEIERQLGTKANNLQALRGELQGEGGWNTAKIATVHGQPAADELAASVDRNLAFRDTHNKVVENSQTAQRQAAAGAMKPVPPGDVPLVNPNMSLTGLLATGAKKTASAALNAVRPDPARSYGEVARVLTEQGTTRDARIQAIIQALDRRNANSAVATSAGNQTALLGALAANGLENNRRRNRQRP